MAKPPEVQGPARDLLADRFEKHAEEIYRLYRAGIRATQRHQLTCPHCGGKHDYRVKDLDAARPWAVAWREIRYGKPAQQAAAPAKAGLGGKGLEDLSMDELYALAFQDDDEEEAKIGDIERNAEGGEIGEATLDTSDDTMIPSQG